MSPRDARGVSLTELVIVMALATLVMLSLASFYFGSQNTWIDASTQALSQQDATLITEKLATWVRKSGSVTVNASDVLHNTLLFNDAAGQQIYQFMWNPADSLLEEGIGPALSSLTPCANSKVTRFQLTTIGDSLVSLDLLELKSADGRLIRTASTFACYSRK